ncbi:MAG: hypothetical protein AAF495_24920 [Pseudomonadota bacterium]
MTGKLRFVIVGCVLLLSLSCTQGRDSDKKSIGRVAATERIEASVSDMPITLRVRIDDMHEFCDFHQEAVSIGDDFLLAVSGPYRCFGVIPTGGTYETESGPNGVTRVDLKKLDPDSIRFVTRDDEDGQVTGMNAYFLTVAGVVVPDEDAPPYVAAQCFEEVIISMPKSEWCVTIGAGDAMSHYDSVFLPCETEELCSLIVSDLKRLAKAAGAED